MRARYGNSRGLGMKASFGGLFRTNFTDHFGKLFLCIRTELLTQIFLNLGVKIYIIPPVFPPLDRGNYLPWLQ